MGVTVLPEGTLEGARVQGGKQAFTSQTISDWVRPTEWPALPDVKATDHKVAGLVAVTNDDANFLTVTAITGVGSLDAGSGWLTQSVTSGSSSTDASTYTTASVTLRPGNTYILSVENSHGTDASAVSSITSSTSGLPTFTVRATTQFNGTLNRVTVLTATYTGTATLTLTLTINFGGTTQTGACWALDRVIGAGNLTDDAIVQTATATGSSGTPSVTLGTLATGSATYGVQAHAAATASTPGSGYTETNDVTTATPGQALQTEYKQTGATTVDASITSAAWGMIGLEIRLATYTVDWGDGTVDDGATSTPTYHQYVYANVTSPVMAAGHKVAVVTITSNGCIGSMNLVAKHNQSGLQNDYSYGWLEIAASTPVGSVSFGDSSSTRAILGAVQRLNILSETRTNFNYRFINLYNLRSLSIANTGTLTNTASAFQNCRQLTRVPILTTSSVTAADSMFSGCANLLAVPAYNFGAATSATNMFASCSNLRNVGAMTWAGATVAPALSSLPNLASVDATGFTRAISIASGAMSKAAIETFLDNLGTASGAQTVTISGNWGAPTAISKASSGTTSGSTTVTIADTSSLTTGMEISGTGISDAVAVTFQDTGDTVTRTAHGIPNDTPVSFATVVTTTGIATYTRYYVVNATANTFQVSDTVGGSAKALTTDGSGTCLYGTTITSITANTSIELSIPASATGSVTTSSALLKRSKARLKGFTVSG